MSTSVLIHGAEKNQHLVIFYGRWNFRIEKSSIASLLVFERKVVHTARVWKSRSGTQERWGSAVR